MADDPGKITESGSAILAPSAENEALAIDKTQSESVKVGAKSSKKEIKPEAPVSQKKAPPEVPPSTKDMSTTTRPLPSQTGSTVMQTNVVPVVDNRIAQEVTALDEDFFPDEEKEDEKKWYQSIDWSPFLDICLLSAVLDPSQAQLLDDYSRVFGGMYFLFAYFVLVCAVQLPLTFLLLHWGQFSQSGLSTVTYQFGRAFRALGYAIITWHILDQGVLVKEAAVQLGHNMMMAPKLDYFVQCYTRDTDCHLNCDKAFCCDSLRNRMTCDWRRNPKCSELTGEVIDANYHGLSPPGCKRRTGNSMFRSKPAASLYLESNHLPVDLSLGAYANVAVTLMVIGCVAVASAGNPTFFILYGCLGLVTIFLVVVHCGILLATGSLMAGLNRIIRLSQLHRFCSIEVVYALFKVLISPVNLKFFALSMASFRKKRADAYSMSIQMTLVHLVLSTLFLTANIAMTARLNNDGHENEVPVTSHVSVADFILHKRDHFWQSIVPEFYGTYGLSSSYGIFALMLFFLHLMPILGPFFSLCELKRHHESLEHPRFVVNTIFACLMGGAVLYVAGVTLKYPNVAGRWHGMAGHGVGGILLFLFHLVTVQFYGSGEFQVDMCFLYPVSKTVHSRYSPQSKVFRFMLRVVVPLALLVLLIFQLCLNFTFDQVDNNEPQFPIGDWIEYILPVLPCLVLLAVFAIDLGRWAGASAMDAIRGYHNPYHTHPFKEFRSHPSYVIQEKEAHG